MEERREKQNKNKNRQEKLITLPHTLKSLTCEAKNPLHMTCNNNNRQGNLKKRSKNSSRLYPPPHPPKSLTCEAKPLRGTCWVLVETVPTRLLSVLQALL